MNTPKPSLIIRHIGNETHVIDIQGECIMQHGGALSHHHGVGYEHAKWMEQENSPAGIEALRAVKRALDSQMIMNPAKLFDGA